MMRLVHVQGARCPVACAIDVWLTGVVTAACTWMNKVSNAVGLQRLAAFRIDAIIMAALDVSLSTPTGQGAVSAQQLVDCTTAV